ncbi:MAG: alcohol dehydrogenase [Holophagaceae bacterium]|nr:alcohol dehydrogenase [Holophagaceae bacterium]
MRAMVFEGVGKPLREVEIPVPQPGPGQVLLRVLACAVCRTDLHILDGDLTEPTLPLVLGHEIVGRVEALGPGAVGIALGQRLGVPWLGETCGSCPYCLSDRENLCDHPVFTGYQRQGGYAEFVVADAAFCFPIPDAYSDAEAAPLLCAGLIGYRAYRMAGDARTLGIYGFGAAAHILCQVAVAEGRQVFAFTREGDAEGQSFALKLGASWAGSSLGPPPVALDAAILFAPVGALVPLALQGLRKGGIVVCGGIHMSPIPAFDYSLLWGERRIQSVANLTRQDGQAFFELAARIPLRVEVQAYPLKEAQRALDDLRAGKVQGAAVLKP